jgi:hypothetical protein
MLPAIKDRRRALRSKLSQHVQLLPFDSQLSAETTSTRNLSRRGFYFETTLGHYSVGMYVRVTLNFSASDPVSRQEVAHVVRVEELRSGKFGVAICVLPDIGRGGIRWL